MGLERAGFAVTGIDLNKQPHYRGGLFIQADALKPPVRLQDFDFIWASPPCQHYSITAKLWPGRERPALIEPVRAMLKASGALYAIENVPGAPLHRTIELCGLSFGLRVYRHRLFETSFFMLAPAHETHKGTTNSSRTYSTFATGADMICVAGHNFKRTDGAEAMGIDWYTTREELAQAIPPAYAEYIGRAALRQITQARAA